MKLLWYILASVVNFHQHLPTQEKCPGAVVALWSNASRYTPMFLLYMSSLFIDVPTWSHGTALLFFLFFVSFSFSIPCFASRPLRSPCFASSLPLLLLYIHICFTSSPFLFVVHHWLVFVPCLLFPFCCVFLYACLSFSSLLLLRSLCSHSCQPPLQASKPNHSAEGGGSGQSLPPHVGSLGQAEDQSCPAKRRRASSPAKVTVCLW